MRSRRLLNAAWRAFDLYDSKGFRTAYIRGATAALNGRSARSCPYAKTEGWRAWRQAWLRGHHSITGSQKRA